MMYVILKTDVNEWVTIDHGGLLILGIILHFVDATSLNIFPLACTVLFLFSPWPLQSELYNFYRAKFRISSTIG